MDVLQSIKEKLQQYEDWPILYMFKFIVPSDMQKIARVEALFSATAIVHRKESKNGRFVSITAKQHMHMPEQIIELYRKAAKIEDIMAL